MSKGKARGKRYETALRVGSLANLALVSARSARAIEARTTETPPTAARAGGDQGGQWAWTSSWR